MRPVCYLISLLAFLPAPSLGAELEEYGCYLMVSENGERKTVAAPGLRVLDYNNENRLVRFQSDGTSEVTAVFCSRSSAIPAEHDYQVILAGVPFYIKANDRLVVLEFLGREYRLRLLAGPAFTDQEQVEVSTRLKGFLQGRSVPEPPPNNSFKPKPLRGSA
jgi:hypothetical protein